MAQKYLLPSVALLAWLAAFNAFAASPIINLGRDRAIEDCSSCHQVTANQKPPAPVADPDAEELVIAPSFAQIASKYEGHDRELRAFIVTPDHPMKEQEFLASDLNAIVAYIHALAKKH